MGIPASPDTSPWRIRSPLLRRGQFFVTSITAIVTFLSPASLSQPEIEDKVAEFSKDGMSSAIIGPVFRDQWAVLNVKLATVKTVTEILKEKGLYGNLPEDPSSQRSALPA